MIVGVNLVTVKVFVSLLETMLPFPMFVTVTVYVPAAKSGETIYSEVKFSKTMLPVSLVIATLIIVGFMTSYSIVIFPYMNSSSAVVIVVLLGRNSSLLVTEEVSKLAFNEPLIAFGRYSTSTYPFSPKIMLSATVKFSLVNVMLICGILQFSSVRILLFSNRLFNVMFAVPSFIVMSKTYQLLTSTSSFTLANF